MTPFVKERPIAVVLDMGMAGLGIVRSLGREGIPVVGLDFARHYGAGLRSRYCTPFLSTHPEREPKPLLRFLLKLAKGLRERAVMYPATEPYVRFASKFRSELEAHYLLSIPHNNVIDSVIDKRKQYVLAHNVGVSYPSTYSLDSFDQLEDIKCDIKYPVFIKPCYSKGMWNELYPDVKGFLANNAVELISIPKRLTAQNLQAFAQSVVRGPDSNVFEAWVYISKNGTPLSTFITRKLRQYPVMFGNATLMVSVHDNEIVRFALRFFKGIDYRGLGFIEIKKDDVDGKYKFIELNPRLSIQNILAMHAGVNFPLIQYKDLIGSSTESSDDYKDGVKWLDMTFDLLAFLTLRKGGRLSVYQWLKSISDTDCHAFFANDDLKPFLKQYRTRLARIPKYLARHFTRQRIIG